MNLTGKLFAPCDSASLAFFRITFGVLLFVETCRYFINGWIGGVFVAPPFHFTYLGFDWVRPFPPDAMYLLFIATGIAALLVAFGIWTRTASFFLACSLTYVLLLEKAAYLNHLYLICLLAFLLSFVPTDSMWSITRLRRHENGSSQVPTISLLILRSQVAIPYVYGAIAKLNGDWLSGQPMQMWMSRMTHVRAFVPAFGDLWLALVFSYGGFFLDLLIVPLLVWKRTRPWALTAAIAFHLCNAIFFRIGIFPWMMICATTLFLSPSWPRRFLHRLSSGTQTAPAIDSQKRYRQRVAVSFTAVWFAMQLLVPFRHLLYPGKVDWTEEGYHFSWRMMLNDKAAAMRLLIVDPQTKSIAGQIDPRQYLTPVQIDKMSYSPDMLVQFSQYVANELRKTTGGTYEIHAQVLCSLNGRRPQLLVDPEIDLAAQRRTMQPLTCIVPLHEPLLFPPWSSPPASWQDVESMLQKPKQTRD